MAMRSQRDLVEQASIIAARIQSEHGAAGSDPLVFMLACKLAVELKIVHVLHDFPDISDQEVRGDAAKLDNIVHKTTFTIRNISSDNLGTSQIAAVIAIQKPEGEPS
jgi:hypothetical protein